MSYTDKLTALSTSIKSKAGLSSSETLSLVRMKEIIDGLSSGVDASIVTATVADVLAAKKVIIANGTLVDGTMTNNGAVSKVLTSSSKSYTIPAGYHNGSGTVKINAQTKTVSSSTSAQTVTADSNYCLTGVTIGANSNLTIYTGSFTLGSSSGYDNTYTGTVEIPVSLPSNSNDYSMAIFKRCGVEDIYNKYSVLSGSTTRLTNPLNQWNGYAYVNCLGSLGEYEYSEDADGNVEYTTYKDFGTSATLNMESSSRGSNYIEIYLYVYDVYDNDNNYVCNPVFTGTYDYFIVPNS